MTAVGSPAVSVVIPAYNAGRFIRQTLESVRAQTYTNFEVLVVDDGSTDGSGDLARAWLSEGTTRGRVLWQANRGMAAARNAGMRAAAGEFIALLDSDDLWYPAKLATVMSEFERYPDADLICHDERLTRNGRCVRVTRRRMPLGSLHDALLFDGNTLSPSAVVIRRAAALSIGGFDERQEYLTVEDYDFWLRFSRARRVRFLGAVLGDCVLHDDSASRRIGFHHLALERMLSAHLQEYLRVHGGPVAHVRTRRRLARVYRSAARQLMTYHESPEAQRVFVVRMLRAYPLELRNLAVALLWIGGMLRGRAGLQS